MALLKNKASVPFSAGLETKTDRAQDQLQGLRILENVVFDTPKKLLKRKGYNIVDTKLLNNSEIENAKYLSSFENELGLLTESNYYAYAESLNKWTDKGQVFTAFPSSKTVLRNEREQKNIDCLSLENVNVYIYQDSTGIRLSMIDNANCNFLISNELLSASGEVPRICNIENTLYAFYIDGTDLKFRKINLLNPENIETEQVFINNVESTDKKFDCTTVANKIFIAYNSSDAGGTLQIGNIDSDDNISSFLSFGGEDASQSISTSTDTGSRFIVSFSTGSDVKVVIVSFTLTTILTATTVESIADAVNSTVIESDVSTGEYTVFYEISSASPKDHIIRKNTVQLSAATGTPSLLKRSVGLASKSFTFNDTIYVNAVHSSALQSTYLLLDENSNIVSKSSPNTGGDLITENVLSKVTDLGDDKFITGTQIKGRLTIDADTFFSLLGVNSTVFDFSITDPFQNETLGKNLHIAGGIPMMYDGDKVVEHGFHIFPEDLTAGSTSTVGGSMVDGAYQYSAVYTWTDNKGQIHTSAPSIGLDITLAGATATQQQDIVVPTLRLTQKDNVVIDLYRTEAAGTIFYKVTSVSTPIENDPSIDTITINDTTSDADLINNEVLYTTGGVLDNIAAPSSSIIESFSDRIFLAGLEDENRLQFSKIRFQGAPVEFNDTLTIQLNSKGGPITALAAMDEKLVIFKESALFYLSGDGPNNLGQQDTFIKPELVSSDIGCINVDSVVLTPSGLMFKSKKGIYLLSRGLQLSYIGANVEIFNDLKISSAIVIPEENQVRFTTEDGDTLVYNYYVQQWASFTNHRALSAINIGFTYYYLRNDGILYVEDETGYTDNGSPINIKLASGWISFAGVQGFQRVYKLLLLGTFKSPHKLKIRIAYDFNESLIQEAIIDTADFTDNTRYGDYSPYGEPDTVPYGGEGNVYQMRIDLKRQKCQAIKIRIEEIQSDTDNLGEGLTLSNVMFEIGQKVGTNKVDTARKYGTE